MKIGTKSVLFGAHCFALHPFFVAAAWIRLYGFPFDPRIWIAFFVHDLGYLWKPNMDGPEGETHVELGAAIMHLFDGWRQDVLYLYNPDLSQQIQLDQMGYIAVLSKKIAGSEHETVRYIKWTRSTKWRDFSLYHSRYYAKKNGAKPSKLCFADKLSFAVTPRWLYLPMVNATGEINEYLKNAKKAETAHWKPVEGQRLWHKQLREYMIKWVNEHKDGSQDTWTNPDRHAATESGVWK